MSKLKFYRVFLSLFPRNPLDFCYSLDVLISNLEKKKNGMNWPNSIAPIAHIIVKKGMNEL